ncbi:MAG: CoA transferase [Acidobacteria bacterium]|nr:CoA transferase [Acidobacteriota bacterium]
MRPLDGITVLDLTRLLPGAAATQLVSDFGAEVLKIEQPGLGDYGRHISPAVFSLVNRGKKSVALDLKDPHDKDALLRLADRADVLIESFRPGVMQRLGLGYETLRARNQRLIYVALTGYGQTGPCAGMAGHDINYVALAGLLEPPCIPNVQMADLAGGAMQAVIGILLALEARHRTGRGQMVDVAMRDGVMALAVVPMAGSGAMLSGRYACYNLYQAQGGRWVAVGALEPKFWVALCRGLGCEQLIPEQFAENPRQAEMKAELARIFQTKTAEEWFEHFRSTDACVTPVRTLAEAGEIPLTPRLSETPGQAGGAVPRLGEHTREVT